jgi:hypothetical protein
MSRRKKLILAYGTAGLAVVLAASAAVLLARHGSRETYSPGGTVEGITATLDRDLPSDYPRVQFKDVTTEAGIRIRHFDGARSTQLPEDMGSGAAWGDYDNDGRLDLFIANIAGALTRSPEELAGSPAGSRLYHNESDGTFDDVTEDAGLSERGAAMAAAWGDADGDGFLDLVVTRYGGLRLYRNNRDGTLSDVTQAAGLSGFEGFWTGASWADYDKDGDLDLYVCGYVQYRYRPEDAARSTLQYQATVPYTLNPSSYAPERNLLFRNEAPLRFREVAKAAGVDNPQGRSLSAAWCDFDEDGWLDLYVANDVSDNVLYRNLGNGRFADVSHAAWVADYRGAMGLAIADWDGDEDQDIFVTHWIAQENALYSNLKRAFDAPPAPPGELRFMDVADMVGLGQIALDYIGWGTSFVDYDNDGRPDLFVVNGSTFQDPADPSRLAPMRNLLFWNAGKERGFFEVGTGSGEVFSRAAVGRGAAFADYDADGDLDVLVVNHGGPALLLRNEGGHRNNWLSVRALMRKGNRFGLGARVQIEAGGQRQTIQIGSQPSYLSQNPYEAHFGLGQAERVDRLVVVFPDGSRVERTGVPVNQRLTVFPDEASSR